MNIKTSQLIISDVLKRIDERIQFAIRVNDFILVEELQDKRSLFVKTIKQYSQQPTRNFKQ